MTELRKLTTKWTLDATEYIQGAEKTITKTKQISASTEEGQKALQKHIKELKGTSKITADQFNVMSAEVKKAEREAKKADKAFNQLNAELIQEQKMLNMTAQEQRIFNAELRLGAGATEAQKRELRELIIANDAMAKSSGKLTGSMRMQRNGFSQMQYQLQDIAVQMQMGTNPFTILGQQGPQIAALFGPGGAVAGSIIAFGAMFGGVALSSLLDFESATDKLEDSLDKVAEQATLSKFGLLEYSEVLVKIKNRSEEAAQALIQQSIGEQAKANAAAIDVIREAVDDAAGSVDSLYTLLTGVDASDWIGDSSESIVGTVHLRHALDALYKKVDQQNITKVREELLKFAESGKFVTKEAQDLGSEIIKTLDKLEDGVITIDEFNKAIEDMGKVGDDSADKNRQNRESIEELVKELEQEATTYGMTADAIVLYNAALKGATQEQIQAIINSQEIIRAKKAEEQAYKDARKAEKDDIKDAEKRQKSYDRLMDKAFNDQLKRYDDEEKAKRALEGMKNDIAKQSFNNLAQLAEEGSMIAKLAFLGQQAIAANEVVVNAQATKAKYLDNPAMISLIEGQMYASLATIAGTTVAGVFHGGGAVPGGDHEQTYLLKGGEYVESRAERREIDKLMAQNNSGEVSVNLSYNIQSLDAKGVKQVLLENNSAVYASVQQAMRKQGRTL